MTSLVNKSADWTPNYHKILIFFPTKSLKSLCAARIDELADSNEPALKVEDEFQIITIQIATDLLTAYQGLENLNLNPCSFLRFNKFLVRNVRIQNVCGFFSFYHVYTVESTMWITVCVSILF